jgi:predicted amidohydrolase YtcJ
VCATIVPPFLNRVTALVESDVVERVLRGGRVWTSGRDRGRPATSVVIEAGRIALVGSDEEAEARVGPSTEVVDLKGRWAIPGFVDAHTHFIDGGRRLAEVDLRGVAAPRDFHARIAGRVGQCPAGEWITGANWDEQLWGGPLPNREWVDRVAPHNPVFLVRSDLHMGVANSLALRRAGVDEHTADPRGGRIDRDDGGSPTGIVRDSAMGLVLDAIPADDAPALDAALERASAHALARGVTQVHDMGQWAHFDTYRRAHARGRLAVRVYSVVPMSTRARLAALVSDEGRGDQRLWWGGLKAFVDGSLGSSTAWFRQPYADDPATVGLVVTDLDALSASIMEAERNGLQSIVHAIGDHANDWLLDVYSQVGERFGRRDRRFRIEHAQHLSPAAADRFGEVDVVASVQPAHLADDGAWAELRIGRERARRAYAFRSLLDGGAAVAFGSDWTVAPLDPLLGLRAAVDRRTRDGANPEGWIAEQKISPGEALLAYTQGAAYAGFSDGWTGRLVPGMCADIAVLSGDPFEEAGDINGRPMVDLTLIDGHIVFERRGGR